MEHRSNKTMLVFLFWCSILLNSAPAICVAQDPNETTPTSSNEPSPSLPQQTPGSSPKPKLPTSGSKVGLGLNIGVGPIGLNVGVGVKLDPKIKALCAKSDDANLCLTTIAPVYNGKTDLLSVIQMMIKAATDQVKQAMATAKKMANDPRTDAKTRSGYKDCEEMYDDALDNFQEALDAIPIPEIGTVNIMLSAAITDISTCDDGFTGQPNPIPDGVSPMAKLNEHLMNIVGVMLSIVKMIPIPT
ncbi:hypothetical protein PTKIN_Ptkin10aG0008900 [Pterospermum kingtungense]